MMLQQLMTTMTMMMMTMEVSQDLNLANSRDRKTLRFLLFNLLQRIMTRIGTSPNLKPNHYHVQVENKGTTQLIKYITERRREKK